MLHTFISTIGRVSVKNRLLILFTLLHILFAVFLGQLYALAPDESGYLSTFNKIYSSPININSISAQTGSGWIAAPTLFLLVVYLPAKILNMLGVADYLAIRFLSIGLTVLALKLILDAQGLVRTKKYNRPNIVFMVFFIPSIFLWTSVGLREAFIIAELAVFFAGLRFLINGFANKGILFLFFGSYGLISTKSYLWACLMIALILSSTLFLLRGIERRKMVKFVVAGFLLPSVLFAGTTSAYALAYIFQSGNPATISSNISATGARSGDSVTQIYVEVPRGGDDGVVGSDAGREPVKELITFHGDYTLIALHFYLANNPHSFLSKMFRVTKLDKKIESIWDDKVALGLVQKDKQVGTDTSSLNGHIVEPAKIKEPITFLRAGFVFLCGPFPLIGEPGIAVSISSFESPLWWVFYGLVIFQFIRFRKVSITQSPQIVFTFIFLVGEVLLSALVEVNLGTSFRRRSILLVPLVFLYLQITESAKKFQKLKVDKESSS